MSTPNNPTHSANTGTFALRCRRTITPAGEIPATVIIKDGTIVGIEAFDFPFDEPVIEISEVLMPGLVDSHVHINEPGRTDWEGFDTATHAAAAGGITTLVDMPLNCIPVTTSAAALEEKLKSVTDKLWVDCGYWGGATADNLNDLPELVRAGVLGVKSFTIHSGIDEFQSVDEAQLFAAMKILAQAGLPHLVHAELEPPHEHAEPAYGATTNDANKIGKSYARFLASRPTNWENDAIAMVIRVMTALTEQGLSPHAHIVHLSSAEALPMIKAARDQGLYLTVETCPHYLTLAAETIPDGGTLYKCCPPVREQENQEKLWQGIEDGTIDFIVSDHSPCTPQLKALDTGDIGDAWGGISALQFGLSLIWTEGQKRGFTLTQIAHLMATQSANVAGLGGFKGQIAKGFDADFCVFSPSSEYTVTAECIKHKHKVSPYIGKVLKGKVMQTWLRGQCIFDNDQYLGSPIGESLLCVED